MLKNNKFLRRLALLLCLSLIVGLIPTGIWSIPFTVNAVPEGTVVFSDNVEGYDFLKKWTKTGSVLAWSDAGYRYEGERVLLVQTPNDTITSPAFEVIPGKEYTLSYWTMQHTAPATPGKGSAQIRFYNASGSLISGASAKAVACGVTEWTEKTLTAIAPEGAATAKLYFDSEGDGKLIYVVDVITVTERDGDPGATVPTQATEATEATQPADNPVVNAGFESGLENWNQFLTAEVVTDSVHSGTSAVKLTDDTKTGGGYISQSVPVTPGKTYELSLWVKVLSGSAGYFGIYGIGNAAVAGDTGRNSSWTKVSVSVTIPDNYTSAIIEIGSSKSAMTTYLVDDVVFAEVGAEPEVTEPSTEATEPSTQETAPAGGEGTLVFEDDIEAYNFKTKWSLTGNTMRWPPNPGFGYQGEFVLILQGNGDTATSPAFAVTPGKEYRLSYWTRQFAAGAAGHVEIRFYNAGGAQVGASMKMDACGAAEFTEKTLVTVAPAGAASAKIFFDAPGENYVVDVIKVMAYGEGDPNATEPSTQPTETEPVVTVPTEPTEPTEPPVFADSFEEYFTPDGANRLVRIPNNWEPSEFTAALGCAQYDKNYDGSWNLCIQDAADKSIKSPLVEAIAGYEYNVVFHEKKYQPGQPGAGGYVKIVFVDADGKVLKEYEIVAGTSKNWTEKILYSKAPEGAKSFYVEFGLKSPSGEPTYSVDDLAVYAYEAAVSDPDVTQPTEPVVFFDPMKPLDDKFEEMSNVNDLNAGPAGWYSNDDNSGVFAPMIGLVNDELSYDGNYLRLQKAGKWSIQSPEFPVEVGYAYTAAFMARKLADNENYFGFVEICFINTRGKIVESKQMTVGKTYGEWAEESLTVTAPIGAIKAYIRFALEYNDRRADGDFAIDNLVLSRSEEQVFEYTPDPNSTEPSEYKTIFEDTFASYDKPDPNKSVKIPKGWTASEQSAAIGSATYDSYDGSINLVLQDRANKWIKSPMIKATAGNIYYANFLEKKLQPNQDGSGGYVKICFVDDSGKVIQEYMKAVGASKTWTELDVGGQAPAGTTQLYVEFGIKDGMGAPSFSVENLTVIEGVPSKPGSQPSEPGTQPDVDQPGATTPSDPDNNPNSGDDVALVTVSAMLIATLALAVLVIRKRRFF